MRIDVKKCGAHNVVHGLRETCPRCAEARRAETLARAPLASEKAVRWASHAENKEPPAYPESRYAPKGPLAPYGDFAAQNTARLKADVAYALAGLDASPIRILPLRRAEDYNEVCSLVQEQGLEIEWQRFGTQGAIRITRPPVPFFPETFCPPGRAALEMAGYECSSCYEEGRGGAEVWRTSAKHSDGTKIAYDSPYYRVRGGDDGQAERFLTFAWETMALDAGLDGILADLEEEDG